MIEAPRADVNRFLPNTGYVLSGSTVVLAVLDPNYTFDPAVFPELDET